jgi:hypothetical protein
MYPAMDMSHVRFWQSHVSVIPVCIVFAHILYCKIIYNKCEYNKYLFLSYGKHHCSTFGEKLLKHAKCMGSSAARGNIIQTDSILCGLCRSRRHALCTLLQLSKS